jgi:hypothetical protein
VSVPDWWEAVLLALAAWRVFHLLAHDDILNPIRRYVTGLPPGWDEGDRIPPGYREKTADFLSCPFCLGFWIALAWWGAWELWDETLIVATPWAISAGVIGAHKFLSAE